MRRERFLPWIWAAAAACLGVRASPSAHADAPAEVAAPTLDPAVEAASAALGTHPDDKRIRAGVDLALSADEASATRWVGALWHALGPAASRGLSAMTAHDSDEVRRLALEGIARAGLRTHEARACARRLTDARDKGVRMAAMAALGRIGDRTDLAGLLGTAKDEDPDLRTAAFRALETLTGEGIRRDATLWAEWWAELEPSAGVTVATLLERIRGDADDVRDVARAELKRRAWCDLELVERTAREWLRSSAPDVRGDGFELIASARLAEHADEVASGLRYERHPVVWDIALAAAVVLGLPTEDLRRPGKVVPDRRFDRP